MAVLQLRILEVTEHGLMDGALQRRDGEGACGVHNI